jgi:cobalt-zinc-cadmium efflux system protein
MPDGHPGDAALDQVADDLQDRFGITHATLQIELGDGAECDFASPGVI